MTERKGPRRRTARFKRLKTRRVTPEKVIKALKEAKQLYHFLAYAQEVGLAGIRSCCGFDVWRSNLPGVFSIGRDNTAFAYLDMRESQKGAIDSSSNMLAIRVEADIFNEENKVIGCDYFAVCVRLVETGELQIEGRWIYDCGAGWPEEEGVMTEIHERVEGVLEVLKTLRMPLSPVAV